MTCSRMLPFALVLTAGLLIPLAASPQNADDAKKASSAKKSADAKKGGSTQSSPSTPGEEFKKSGESAENYEKAGRAAGSAGKSLGQKTADGDLVGGSKDFGKGMGEMGKEVGVGTAKVGVSVGRGIGRVFGGKPKDADSGGTKSDAGDKEAQTKEARK
jgi:hypothetical protein